MRYLVFALAVVLLAAPSCLAATASLNATLVTPDATYNTIHTTLDLSFNFYTGAAPWVQNSDTCDSTVTGTQNLELTYTVASGVVTPTAIKFIYNPSAMDYTDVDYDLGPYPTPYGFDVYADVYSGLDQSGGSLAGCSSTGGQENGQDPNAIPAVPITSGSFSLDTSTSPESDQLIYVSQGSFTLAIPLLGSSYTWELPGSDAWNDGASRRMTGNGSVSAGAINIGATGLATHDVDIQVPLAGAKLPVWNSGSDPGPNPLGELALEGTIRMTAQVGYQLGPGDANGDGNVDLLDLGVVGDHWNATGVGWQEGDFNGDTNVDLLDLGTVGDNWNVTYSYAEGTAPDAVPEPSTLTLLVLGAVASFLFFRRQRSS